jgi:hypothetical protein
LGTVENKNSTVAEPSLTVRPNVPIVTAPGRSARPTAEVSRSRYYERGELVLVSRCRVSSSCWDFNTFYNGAYP